MPAWLMSWYFDDTLNERQVCIETGSLSCHCSQPESICRVVIGGHTLEQRCSDCFLAVRKELGTHLPWEKGREENEQYKLCFDFNSFPKWCSDTLARIG